LILIIVLIVVVASRRQHVFGGLEHQVPVVRMDPSEMAIRSRKMVEFFGSRRVAQTALGTEEHAATVAVFVRRVMCASRRSPAQWLMLSMRKRAFP
jgi:hypothetical protein